MVATLDNLLCSLFDRKRCLISLFYGSAETTYFFLATTKVILSTEEMITATFKVISATTKEILANEEVITVTLKVSHRYKSELGL